MEYPACTTLHADNVRVYIVSDDDKPQFEQSRATLALSSETTVPPDQMEAQEARMRRALGLNGESARMRAPQERGDSSPSRQMERFTPGIHKRRFVQDGEVPVTLVHGLTPGRRDHADSGPIRGGAAAGPTNRLEVAELALASEIASRDRADKALAEAQAVIHDLRTKLGHADLAQQEAVAALRREKDTTAELRAALAEAEERTLAAQEETRSATERASAPPPARLWHDEDDDEPAPAEKPPARRGRPPGPRAMGVIAQPSAVVAKPAKPAADVATEREPKPIRWWLTSKRAAKKR